MASISTAAAQGVIGNFQWQTATPESQRMSTPKLDSMKDALATRATKSLLVVRNDKIVYEWYASGMTATTQRYMASASKGLVGGIALAVAIQDGKINLSDHASIYVPSWSNDPMKNLITIEQLGTHSAGLADAGSGEDPINWQPWEDIFWQRRLPPEDPFTISRDRCPVYYTPGKSSSYSNPGFAMLAYATTVAIGKTQYSDGIRTLLRSRVMDRIGVPSSEYSVGYGTRFTVDGLPMVPTWGGSDYTARAAARASRLLLRKGDWEGTQIISQAAVDTITLSPGIGWYHDPQRIDPAPAGSFIAGGSGHNVVFVVPTEKLLVVRQGDNISNYTDFWEPVRTYVIQPVLAAITGSPPPPPSSEAPTISNFSPTSGPVGTTVTLYGTNFTGATAVTFNNIAASITSLSATQLTTAVPSGATTGKIRVTTPGGTANSATDFTVTTAPSTGVPTHAQTVTGGATDSNSVSTSAGLIAVTGDLYLAAVTTKFYKVVSKVSGLGLAWTKVKAQCSARNQTGIEVWMARGTPTGDSTVTATLSATTANAVIAVSRYSGVSSTPVNVVSGNTLGVNGTCTGGTDKNAYSFNLPQQTTGTNSVVYGAAAMRNRTHTPGSGYTERAEFSQGASGDMAGIAIESKVVGSPSTVLVNGTFSGTVDWAVIGLEIKP